jgi:hypothetical protein
MLSHIARIAQGLTMRSQAIAQTPFVNIQERFGRAEGLFDGRGVGVAERELRFVTEEV